MLIQINLYEFNPNSREGRAPSPTTNCIQNFLLHTVSAGWSHRVSIFGIRDVHNMRSRVLYYWKSVERYSRTHVLAWMKKDSCSLSTQRSCVNWGYEFTAQIQMLNNSFHMQWVEHSRIMNYFTFNKNIQQYPKQEPVWSNGFCVHPALFHCNFSWNTHLHYQENRK